MKPVHIALMLVLIVAAVAAISTPAGADSLLKESEGLCDLAGTRTAYRVGDIVNIVFKEKTVATQSATGKLKNTYDIGSDKGKGFLQKFLGLGMSGGETVNVEQTTNQAHTLSANLTVVVKEVLPNGNLVVEGTKNLVVNHENQKLTVTGIIRPVDITNANTIDSSKVGNLCSSVNGISVNKSLNKRRGGILHWIWGLLF